MNWHEYAPQALSWIGAIALAVWAWVRAHRVELENVADKAVGIVEKYRAGAREAEMEDAAVKAVFELWPALIQRKRLTTFLVRTAIREACERRKAAAVKAGLREGGKA